MTVFVDPIQDGIPYALPGGRTVWHFPPLPEDAMPEQIAYRCWCLARLDLNGHLTVAGDLAALNATIAAVLSEAYDDA